MAVKSLPGTLSDDLPRSLPFLRRLPALAEAFDAEKMKILLQETICDGAELTCTITECRPGKALYLGDRTCLLQLDLKLLEPATHKVMRALINARLFHNVDDCFQYYQQTLIPLSFGMSGRKEVRAFAKTVAVIAPLKMAIAVFPIDAMLPTLIGATDFRRMMIVFNRTLPEELTREFLIQQVALDLAHYGRYQRCVLRYEIAGEQAGTRAPRRMLVYGKVDAGQQGQLTIQVMNALRQVLRGQGLVYPFRVPAAYGYLTDLNLLLMEALPGEPLIQRLIKEGEGDAVSESEDLPSWEIGGFTIAEAVEACARILLTLHGSAIRLGPAISLETRAAAVKDEIQALRNVDPELGGQLNDWLDEVLDTALHATPMPLCFSHGDYTYTQVIFSGSQGGLVDFDTVCQAEPALDLGQFLAYLRLAMRKDHPLLDGAAERLCSLFLDTYIAGAGDRVKDEQALRERVRVYELISFLRLMVHSWQKLKGRRLNLVLSLLEERYLCLKQGN